jgi:hypothetical protein
MFSRRSFASLPIIGSGILQKASAASLPNADSALVSSTSTGAAGDGKADDTTTLQALLDDLSSAGGGTCIIPAGKFHYIGSANLRIPQNVIVTGAANPFSGWRNSPLATGCGFFLNPSCSLVMGVASSLLSVKVFRSGLLSRPTGAQVMSSLVTWAGENSVAILTPANTGGVVLDEVFIVGFNTGIKSMAGTFYVNRVWIDCYNGMVVSTAGDNYSIERLRCEPYYAMAAGPGPNFTHWYRGGVGLNLTDNGDTGGFIRECFVFCWQIGFQSTAGVTVFSDCGYETQVPVIGADSHAGQTGYYWKGHNAEVSYHDCYCNGGDIGWDIQGAGECMLRGPSISNSPGGAAGFRLGASTYGALYHPDIRFAGSTPGVVVQDRAIDWRIVSPFLSGVGPTSWIDIARGAGRVEVLYPGGPNGWDAKAPTQAATAGAIVRS